MSEVTDLQDGPRGQRRRKTHHRLQFDLRFRSGLEVVVDLTPDLPEERPGSPYMRVVAGELGVKLGAGDVTLAVAAVLLGQLLEFIEDPPAHTLRPCALVEGGQRGGAQPEHLGATPEVLRPGQEGVAFGNEQFRSAVVEGARRQQAEHVPVVVDSQ